MHSRSFLSSYIMMLLLFHRNQTGKVLIELDNTFALSTYISSDEKNVENIFECVPWKSKIKKPQCCFSYCKTTGTSTRQEHKQNHKLINVTQKILINA